MLFDFKADYLYKEKNTRLQNCSSLLKEITEFNGKTVTSLEGKFSINLLYLI